MNFEQILRDLLVDLKPQLIEKGTSKILSYWDGPVLHGSALRRRARRDIAPLLRGATPGQILPVPSGCHRNDVLGAFTELTVESPIELLLVAFGTRRGNATRIEHLCVEHGSVDEVVIPPTMNAAIRNALRGKNAEVIVAHNHPPTLHQRFVDVVLGKEPLPSERDRHSMIRWYWPLAWLRELGTTSASMRFYVTSGDETRQFVMPPAAVIAPLLAEAAKLFR